MTDRTTLEKALESNLALQRTIAAELERLSLKKAENRRTAERLTQQLSIRHSLPSLPPTCNPYRQWRAFFIDSKGKKPEPNPDVLKRRALQDKTFLCHLQPPWSAKENKALQAIVSELLDPAQHGDTASKEMDFELVASLLKKRVKRSSDSMVQARSATECQIQHELLISTNNKIPFSKEESRTISEQVHLHNGYPDWQAIADSLPNNRTAWDCLVTYQTKLCPVQTEPWTVTEDKLLFSYISAAGPQFVIDGNEVLHLAARLFPQRSKKQLSTRINQSLLNPNLQHDAWSDEEERRLAICMKVYRDSSSDLYLSSIHLPHRSTKSVTDKWNRSLNPEYSTKPFTKQEDETLLQIIRTTGNKSWTDLSRRHFPHRHPQRLLNRWSELASDGDILSRSGKELVKGRKRSSRDAKLDADDFVVQVVSKKKK